MIIPNAAGNLASRPSERKPWATSVPQVRLLSEASPIQPRRLKLTESHTVESAFSGTLRRRTVNRYSEVDETEAADAADAFACGEWAACELSYVVSPRRRFFCEPFTQDHAGRTPASQLSRVNHSRLHSHGGTLQPPLPSSTLLARSRKYSRVSKPRSSLDGSWSRTP